MSYFSNNISLERANTNTSNFDAGIINDNTVNAYANLLNSYIADNGGNLQIVSLTIDVLNNEELTESNDIINANWIDDKRKRENLIEAKAIWGFREAYHGVKKSKAISNAFCFANQKLTFYIAQQGHSTGYIDDQWVYCTTSITVSVVNIFDGSETTLKTFNDFEVALDADSRYFEWTVPARDVHAFVDYGLFGLYVIKIAVSNIYYKDALREIPYEGDYPSSNQAYLQLLTYDGVHELLSVDAGDVSIMPPIPTTDNMAEAFNQTVFDSLEALNDNELTEDQKRAIIADQCAVLFMSQHSVLTADFYPGKILGVGIDASVHPRKIIDKAVTYAQRNPNIVSLIKDRLFGMIATYRAFNFATDIEAYIPNYLQSNQIVRDPIRSILMDVNNVVSGDMGINGLSFNPYSMEVVNVDFLHNVPQTLVMDISLYKNIIDIGNIQITKTYGVPEYSVTVSFDVIKGSADIATIKYILFTEQANKTNNYSSYTASNNLSRSHTFNHLLNGPIDSSPQGDLITAQIIIEDIYGEVNSFIGFDWLYGSAERPSIIDLKIYQRNDGSDIVDVYYTYLGLTEINNSYVYVQFSVDKGVTWSDVLVNSLKGDFGSNVQPGRRVVSWNPVVDLADVVFDSYVLCRLTLYDADSKLAVGKSVSGALVLDVDKPVVFVKKRVIDFVDEVVRTVIRPNTVVVFDNNNLAINFRYSGADDTTAIVMLNGISYTVGVVDGYFIWDIGGINHKFVYDKENLSISSGIYTYIIVYDGIGSFLFTIVLDVFNSSSSSSSSSIDSSSSSSVGYSSSSSSSVGYSSSSSSSVGYSSSSSSSSSSLQYSSSSSSSVGYSSSSSSVFYSSSSSSSVAYSSSSSSSLQYSSSSSSSSSSIGYSSSSSSVGYSSSSSSSLQHSVSSSSSSSSSVVFDTSSSSSSSVGYSSSSSSSVGYSSSSSSSVGYSSSSSSSSSSVQYSSSSSSYGDLVKALIMGNGEIFE